MRPDMPTSLPRLLLAFAALSPGWTFAYPPANDGSR